MGAIRTTPFLLLTGTLYVAAAVFPSLPMAGETRYPSQRDQASFPSRAPNPIQEPISTKLAFPDPERMTALLEQGIRLQHAHELMGRYYAKSAVKAGERVTRLHHHIGAWTAASLKGKWKKAAPRVTRTILEESRKHQLDPVFLLSVIETESSFNPVARGPVGEIGLMQLRPTTAEWIAKKAGLRWKGEASLKDPVINIRLGSAYLAWLRDQFESHSQLYISAYNMGIGNVQKSLDNQIWPKQYAQRVMKHYIAFYARLTATPARPATPALPAPKAARSTKPARRALANTAAKT